MTTVATVGTFDGVHRGPWAVLAESAKRAAARGGSSLLVTFDPHPLEVVNPRAAPLLLTTPEEKRLVLAQSPLDRVAFVPFTPALAGYPPERFVREVLEGTYHVAELVIGYDHGFGRGRAGDVAFLRELGVRDGFAVDVVPAVLADGHPISSTAIRRAVAGGDLVAAAHGLGRPYGVTGRVVQGVGRGRTLGAPTLNLALADPRKLLPPDGVYAARVSWQGGTRGAMVNLGARPTFGEAARGLEAHLFDFAGEAYGETVTVEFIRRLRDVVRFPSAEALRRQLEADRRDALAALTQWRGSVNL
jgi:riboflavin kinase/FMN adenylyltransferase